MFLYYNLNAGNKYVLCIVHSIIHKAININFGTLIEKGHLGEWSPEKVFEFSTDETIV